MALLGANEVIYIYYLLKVKKINSFFVRIFIILDINYLLIKQFYVSKWPWKSDLMNNMHALKTFGHPVFVGELETQMYVKVD